MRPACGAHSYAAMAAVVVVEVEIPLDLRVFDTGIHAVEAHQLVAELRHVYGADLLPEPRIIRALSIEQHHRHLTMARSRQAPGHFVRHQTTERQPGEHQWL